MCFPNELSWAHPIIQEWFVTKFGTPTEPQVLGWPNILAGRPTLISAPTGSGKTLAAFLVCIDRLFRRSLEGMLRPTTQVVYVSPLKALSNDIQKNLEEPLREILQLALERGHLSMGIRTGVRTGDTLQKERAAMLRHPPHILVTTPESLYILLTAKRSREHLGCVETVIVDEIHAVADDKRGAHLALSLERLDALVCGENRLSPGAFITGLMNPPQRIGLSATQNPIELVSEFLTGSAPHRAPATIVQVGQKRKMDIAIEVPSDELNSVTSQVMWEEIFDKLAAFTKTHRSTLVFVNTRKLVERVSFALAERLGTEKVGVHHGSLSRMLRLDAERRLKRGEIKILVATASLELGIDIGNIDLVCQISTTRSIAVALQRIGRAGHWRGAVPKGRLFATTRDDLLEQAALVRKLRNGELDRLEIPPRPIDVLMQQIVAACGAEPWHKKSLFEVLRRAYPYRNLTWEQYDEIITILANDAAGLAAADGFDQLRSMIDPDRRRAANSSYRKARSAAGRWSLFRSGLPTPEDAIEQARYNDLAIESGARMLLNRYGVVFRDLLVFESNIPRWGVLLRMLRRLEDRGEVRGGRFVNGFGGEQFALPDVLDSLRATRNQELKDDITIAGSDPVNLIGVLIPGERTHAVSGRAFVIKSHMLEQSTAISSREVIRSRYGQNFEQHSRRSRQAGAVQATLL